MRGLYVFELQQLFVQYGFLPHAGEFPCSDIGELLVIAQSLALFRLMFFAEVTPAGFFPVQSIKCQQLSELKEVSNPSRPFQF